MIRLARPQKLLTQRTVLIRNAFTNFSKSLKIRNCSQDRQMVGHSLTGSCNICHVIFAP